MEGSVKASGVEVPTCVGEGKGVGGGRRVAKNDIVGRAGYIDVARIIGVVVGATLCVSASAVLTVDMAVFIISA